jgi:hypothetical protein
VAPGVAGGQLSLKACERPVCERPCMRGVCPYELSRARALFRRQWRKGARWSVRSTIDRGAIGSKGVEGYDPWRKS